MILAPFFPMLAHAGTTCQTFLTATDDVASVTLSGTAAEIPLGGLSVHGIDPDEIDLTSTCQPTLVMEGLELRGIDPDEIDFTAASELDAGGRTATREHVLLARQVEVPGLLKTTGDLTWEATSITFREEVTSWRPYTSVVVADLMFTLVAVSPDTTGVIPLTAYFETDEVFDGGTAIVPDPPLCSACR